MITPMHTLLQQYIDGELTGAELAAVEQRIADSKEWHTAHEELLQLHHLLHDDAQLMEPSMRFTQNVMEAIGNAPVARPVKAYLHSRIFSLSMAVLFGGLVLLVGYLLAQADFAPAGKSTIPVPDMKLPADTWSFLTASPTLLALGMVTILALLFLAEIALRRSRQATS